MILSLLALVGAGGGSSLFALTTKQRADLLNNIRTALSAKKLNEAEGFIRQLEAAGPAYKRDVDTYKSQLDAARAVQEQQQAIQAAQEAAQAAQEAAQEAQQVGAGVEAVSDAARKASESAEAARSALRQAEVAAQRAGTQQAQDAVRQAQDAVVVAGKSEERAIQVAIEVVHRAGLQAGAAEEAAERTEAINTAIASVRKAFERVQKAIDAESRVYEKTETEFKNIIKARDGAIEARDAALEALKLVKEAPTAQRAQEESLKVQKFAQQADSLVEQVFTLVTQELMKWQEQREKQRKLLANWNSEAIQKQNREKVGDAVRLILKTESSTLDAVGNKLTSVLSLSLDPIYTPTEMSLVRSAWNTYVGDYLEDSLKPVHAVVTQVSDDVARLVDGLDDENKSDLLRTLKERIRENLTQRASENIRLTVEKAIKGDFKEQTKFLENVTEQTLLIKAMVDAILEPIIDKEIFSKELGELEAQVKMLLKQKSAREAEELHEKL